MKMTPPSARIALLAASLALVPAHAYAAPPSAVLAFGPAHPGEAATFAFSFDGKYGPKNGEHVDDTISFKQTGSDSVLVSAQRLKPSSIETSRTAAGAFAVPDKSSALADVIVDYNTTIEIARHDAASYHAGDAWQSKIALRTSPDSWENVTLDVKVAKATAAGTELQASGHSESTLFFGGFTFPLDVTVHVTENLDAHGRLDTALLDVKELTNGGSGPPISYNWRLASK
jgi:hypothetical protein